MNKVKQRRKELGFTFTQLSELTGISRGNLHGIETGKTLNPLVGNAYKIAKALNSTIEELFIVT